MAALKIIILLTIVLSLNKTFRVQLKQGQYLMEDSIHRIPNIQKLKLNIQGENMSIQGGCNLLTTTYLIWEGEIRFSEWISTNNYCNENLDTQIVQTFSQMKKVSAHGGKIFLYSKDGERVLKLRKTK